MTTPGPLHPCSSVPPAPECEDCTRCGFEPCACLRELRPGLFELVPDDMDLELPDEIALGRMLRPPRLFPPQLMFIPRDELHHWLPGVRDAADSRAIAEALIAEELGPELGERSCIWCQEEIEDDFDHDFCEPAEPTSLEEWRAWSSFTGCEIGISPDLGRAVSNSRDNDFRPGTTSAGVACRRGYPLPGLHSRAHVDALLGLSEREPERRGCPVLRPRSGRRAAGGIARRAKPQGEES